MPKTSRTPSPAIAAEAPKESAPSADAEPKRQSKSTKRAAPGGRVVGAIVPQIGSMPADATHFSIHRIAPSGKALEKISIDVDGVGLDEFPVEVLRAHGLDVIRSHGAGLYQLGWLGVDASGKRRGLGKSRRITIGEVATKPARAAAKSAAEIEAEAYRRGREDATRDLSDTFQWRDRMRDDAYKGLLEIATARATAGAAPAAPSAEVTEMRVKLAIMEERQRWEQEQRDRDAEDEEDEDEEADAQALALAQAQNPEGIAAQIATIAAVAKQVAPLLAFVAPLLVRAAPAPAPVIVTPPPTAAPAPAPAAKPKRAPRAKQEADTRPTTPSGQE